MENAISTGKFYLIRICSLEKQWNSKAKKWSFQLKQLLRYSMYSVSQKKAIPFEIKRQCRAFEFECFNSLMSPRMRSSLPQRFFMPTLQVNLICSAKITQNGLNRELKHSNSNVQR